MMRCGLLGEKLGHSYSPAIHAQLADYAYGLYEVAPEALPAFLTGGDFDALNVTIPYKKAVIPYCTELSPIARRLGSVNVLVRRADGTLYGDNADAFGFESMFMHCWRLRERVLDLFEKTTGGRVILSVVKVGGVVRDIDASQMAEIVSVLDGIKGEYTQIMNTLLTDTSVKNRTVGVAVGTFAAGFLRFMCSFLSGVLVWGNLNDGLAAWTYSLTYNGSYMLPETLLTMVAAVLLCRVAPQIFDRQAR